MPLNEHQYELRAKRSDSPANPLINKTTAGSIFFKQTPNEHDVDVATNGAAVRLPKTAFQAGFELSPETAAMLADHSAFDRGKKALAKSKTMDACPYSSRLCRASVHVWPSPGAEEEGEEGQEQPEWPRLEERSYMQTGFHDMSAEIARLARLPGTVPRDIMTTLLSMYRDGWATAVSSRYLSLTEAQQARRADADSLVPWQTTTHVYNGYAGDYWIQQQLANPLLCEKRGKDVLREGALAMMRNAIYWLALCACEVRKANKGFDWESDSEFTVPDSAKEHWKDAIAAMKLFKKTATAFIDANERNLVVKAVFWWLHHNQRHSGPKHYLQFLDSDTEEDPKICEFLTCFNRAEMAHIKAKAAKAWQRARVFFLFKGSISGLGNNASSNHAIRVLVDWWRSFTSFQQLMRKEEEQAQSMDVPETQRDFQAEMITCEDGMTWDKLTQEQRDEANRLWKIGIENSRANTVRDNEARFRAEEEKRRLESEAEANRTSGERSVLAFPKPSALEAFANEQFERHNPEFKKREEAKKLRAESKTAAAAASSSSAAAAASSSKSRKRAITSVDSSGSEAESDENEDELAAIAKRQGKARARDFIQKAFDDDDEDSD